MLICLVFVISYLLCFYILYLFRNAVHFHVLNFSFCYTCIFFLLESFALNIAFLITKSFVFIEYHTKKVECICLAVAKMFLSQRGQKTFTVVQKYQLVVRFFIL